MGKFKVGDRVIMNDIKGVVNTIPFYRDNFPTYRILYNHGLSAMHCHHSDLVLDVQWYRDEKLNKILGE